MIEESYNEHKNEPEVKQRGLNSCLVELGADISHSSVSKNMFVANIRVHCEANKLLISVLI